MTDPIIALLSGSTTALIVYFLMREQISLLLTRIEILEKRIVDLTDQLILVPQGSEVYKLWSSKVLQKKQGDDDHA